MRISDWSSDVCSSDLQTVWQERIAEARIMIDQARLLTLDAAEKMDRFGSREARKEIAMIKVAGPKMLGQVVDWAIQAHGAAGVSDDFGLARQFSRYRGLRLLDGPDEVRSEEHTSELQSLMHISY